MTIWFNIYAVLVLLSIGVITYLLSFISPDFTNGSHPFFWLSFLVISGLYEQIGIRGRVFKVPIWIFGFLAFLTTTVGQYKESGSLIGVIAFIIVVILGLILGAWTNKQRWIKAEKSLSELKQIDNKGIAAHLLFKKLRTAFFIPSYLMPDNYFQNLILGKAYDIKYKKWFTRPNVNKHYIEFFSILAKLTQEDEFNKYAVLMQSSIKNVGSKKVFTIDYSMVGNVLHLIDKKEQEYEIQLNRIKKQSTK